MKQENTKSAGVAITMRNGERASARIVILLVVCFLLGLGAGAYWYRHAAKSSGAPDTNPAASGQQLIALSKLAEMRGLIGKPDDTRRRTQKGILVTMTGPGQVAVTETTETESHAENQV